MTRLIRLAIERLLFGHDVDHDAGSHGPGRGALCAATAAHQPLGSGGQSSHRVGTTLGEGPRIGLARRRSECIEPLVQNFGIGGEQPTGHIGGSVLGVPEGHLAVAGALIDPAHRVGILPRDDLIDFADQSAPAHRGPPGRPRRNPRVDLRHGGLVGDQFSPIGDGREHREIDIARGED